MKFAQLLVTDDQAARVAAALSTEAESLTVEIPEGATEDEIAEIHAGAEEERKQIGRLQLLFMEAASHPEKFPPTGKAASTVRSIVRRAKGTSQPASRSKRRSSRHQRRRADRAMFRRNRDYIEQYNKGVEIMEAENAEHEANLAEIEARTETQPKYTVTDGFGNVIIANVPAEFIQAEDGTRPLHKTIILAERLIDQHRETLEKLAEDD